MAIPPPVYGDQSVINGILLRLTATVLFTGMSLAVRFAASSAPTGQIMFWRSFVALIPIVLYLLVRRQFPEALLTQNPIGHVKRSVIGGASMYFSFLSLAHLPIALATALWFLAPLMAIPAAILFLRERPGLLVTAAAVGGFVGVAVMLWPALSGPSLDVGVAIGVAAGVATAITTVAAKVQIKQLTATEHPGAIAFYFAVICSAISLATLPFGWVDASGSTLFWLAASGLLGGVAHIAMTEAVARAPVSTLAPFEYTALPIALAFDVFIFGIAPTASGLAGAAMIVAAAALVAFGDMIPRRKPASQSHTPRV